MRILALCAALPALLLACSGEGGGRWADLPKTDVVEQWGITWTFADPVPYGRYANGDYWVIGPLTLEAVTPAFDGAHHGLEVNPSDVVAQGFDARVADFDAARVSALPYAAQPGESLVKAISLAPLDDDDCRPCLQTASVLTVVAEPPPDLGATVFRPPYFGAAKPLYSTLDLDEGALPALAPTPSAPPLADAIARFERVRLDHKQGWTGAFLHPTENMAEYGSSVAVESAEGALRLLLDDPPEAKRPLLIAYVQAGIDLYQMLAGGQSWPANGGHGEGRKLPIAVAAALLGDAEMAAAVTGAGAEAFGENGGMYVSDVTGAVLWGQGQQAEEAYWTNVVFDTGSRTISDPYRRIDGGHRPGDSYQFCCTSAPYKATATAARLLPAVQAMWGHDPFFAYVDRWVATGAVAQPDPCAPPIGVCAGGDNAGAACTTASEPEICTGEEASCDASARWDADYGVLFGPDGAGGCILDADGSDGIGRFPALDGTNADGGYYGSPFADEMWDAYL